MSSVYVCGQGRFALDVAERLEADGHVIKQVTSPYWRDPDASPMEDGHLPDRLRSAYREVWVADPAPIEVDLVVAAHSHRFIPKAVREAARVAVGYHPSLLPLHRGRDAIRWQIKMGDRVTGGTVYHLTNRIDAGPIAAQDYLLMPHDPTPLSLWTEHLAPLGVELLARVAADIDQGRVGYSPQDEALATWEPSWERPPLFRSGLLEIMPPDPSMRYYQVGGSRG